MSEHTKGPWEAKRQKFDDDGYVIIVPRDSAWQSRYHFVAEKVPNEANAHLIAAAPDLLSALDALVVRLGPVAGAGYFGSDGIGADLVRARAALSKARGGTR